MTSDFPAETGCAGGAKVNATLRSGSNRLHGSVWEFFHNDASDAGLHGWAHLQQPMRMWASSTRRLNGNNAQSTWRPFLKHLAGVWRSCSRRHPFASDEA